MAFIFRTDKLSTDKNKDPLDPPPPLSVTAATTAASEEGEADVIAEGDKTPPRLVVVVEEEEEEEEEEEQGPTTTTTTTTKQMEALDLVFCMDATGSMSPYIAAAQMNIRAIVDGIQEKEGVDVRFGLVTYRDHPPQEATYVTRVFQFTSDVAQMKAYVDDEAVAAVGGGDGPEAVADALFEILHMEWRPRAAKVAVLIADAPPHGLGEVGDGFPQGCPAGHDPLALARQCAARGITIYSVGCEPALSAFFAAKDFLISLAELTSGIALRLESSALLAEVILGTAVEELALMRLQRQLAREIQGGLDQGLTEATVAAQLQSTLRSKGTKTKQIRQTLRLHPAGGASPAVSRSISASASMAEARAHVLRAAEAAGAAVSVGVGDGSGRPAPMLGMMGRSLSSMDAGLASDESTPCATMASSSCCSSAAPMMAVAATAMPFAAPMSPPPAASSGFGPLISGLLSRRGGSGGGGAHAHAHPHRHPASMERGGSCGSQKWLAAATLAAATTTSAAPAAAAADGDDEASGTGRVLAAGVAALGLSEEGVCEEAEVSTDQILRLVRKTKSLRGQRLFVGEGVEGEDEEVEGGGVASAKSL